VRLETWTQLRLRVLQTAVKLRVFLVDPVEGFLSDLEVERRHHDVLL